MKLKWKWEGTGKITEHEISLPWGFKKGEREFHELVVTIIADRGRVIAAGRTCCTYRQHGCAYLGDCTAQKPPDIQLGYIWDYPEVD